jgi:predicted nucleic acid-binding protein
MRVYLDLCAIQRPLDDLSQLRVRLEAEAVLGLLDACALGVLRLVVSSVHDAETARNPHPARRDFAVEVLRSAAERVVLDEAVAGRASRYGRSGISLPDALHLALAVEASVDFFCTTDDQLIRKAQQVDTGTVSVVTPLELVARLPKP